MSLAERSKNPPQRGNGTKCSINAALEELPDTERDALVAILGDKRWTAPAIYGALIDEGLRVSKQQIQRHRRGDCRCSRQEA